VRFEAERVAGGRVRLVGGGSIGADPGADAVAKEASRR